MMQVIVGLFIGIMIIFSILGIIYCSWKFVLDRRIKIKSLKCPICGEVTVLIRGERQVLEMCDHFWMLGDEHGFGEFGEYKEELASVDEFEKDLNL
jgi:hypothetical protein